MSSILNKVLREFQDRLGYLPLVTIESQPFPQNTNLMRSVLVAAPSSFSEIVRVLRTASTMKLRVRAVGRRNCYSDQLYPDTEACVLVDTSQICDKLPIEFVSFKTASMKNIRAIRVMAGVTVQQLCDFQIQNQIQVTANVVQECHTVVGAIVTGVHAASNRKYGCLADQVLLMTIVDSRGHLVEYCEYDDHVVNLGMLGVVYEVFLRVDPISCVEVRHEFESCKSIFSDFPSSKLCHQLQESDSLRLVYFPMNSLPSDHRKEYNWPHLVETWDHMKDELILRSTYHSKEDTHERDEIHLLDPVLDIDGQLDHVETNPWLTPQFMSQRHKQQKIDKRSSNVQFQPWTSHCFAGGSNANYKRSHLTVTMPVASDFANFLQVFHAIQEWLRISASNGEFPINVCIQVDFTPGSHCRLSPSFDPASLPAVTTNQYGSKIGLGDIASNSTAWFAHVQFHNIRKDDEQWESACDRILQTFWIMEPRAVPQWHGDWSYARGIKEKLLEHYNDGLKQLKKIIELVDRNGMFLNERLFELLEGVVGEKTLPYRTNYNRDRNLFLESIA